MPVLDEITLGGDQGILIGGWRVRVLNAAGEELDLNGSGAFDDQNPKLPSGQQLDDVNEKEIHVTVTVRGQSVNRSSSRTLGRGQAFEKAGWTVTATGIENNDEISRR